MGKFKLGKSTLRNLKTLKNKDLIICVAQAIKETKQDFTIRKSGGLRTAEEQNAIYKRGASQLDGYKYKSYHQSGNAVDLVPFINGRAKWDPEACKEIKRAMLKVANENGIQIVCGADWTGFFDPYHYEIRT